MRNELQLSRIWLKTQVGNAEQMDEEIQQLCNESFHPTTYSDQASTFQVASRCVLEKPDPKLASEMDVARLRFAVPWQTGHQYRERILQLIKADLEPHTGRLKVYGESAELVNHDKDKVFWLNNYVVSEWKGEFETYRIIWFALTYFKHLTAEEVNACVCTLPMQ